MLEKPLFHGGVVELYWIAGGMASGACAAVVKTIQDHSDVTWQWYDWASCQHRLSAPGANPTPHSAAVLEITEQL